MTVLTREIAEKRIASAPTHFAGMIVDETPRFAVVRNADSVKHVEAYMPSNYWVMESFEAFDGPGENRAPKLLVVIGGYDNAGWTLDDYVIPRLGSGLLWATEIV